MKRGQWLLLAALLVIGWQAWQRSHVGAPPVAAPPVGAPSGAIPDARQSPVAGEPAPTEPAPTEAAPTGLPPEVADTLQRIRQGGPFPYDRDGVVFGNFERRLPQQPRGWYHEYTVPTPGAHNRGARRIIAGGRPPSDFWYTGDHYESFTRLDPASVPPGNPR